MAGSQVTTSVSIISSLLGFQAISLEGMQTSAAAAISAGSKVEVAGAFFTFGSDETPQATTWTAITTGLTSYITLTPSGTAGSQVLTAKWSSAVPAWSDSKQGWYTSVGSSIRVIGGCIKGGASSYGDKFLLPRAERASDNILYVAATGTTSIKTIVKKVVELGDWDMDANAYLNISHGITGSGFATIICAQAWIFRDDSLLYFPLNSYSPSYEAEGGVSYTDASTLTLFRRASGLFDATTYNAVGFNRGFLYLEYIE